MIALILLLHILIASILTVATMLVSFAAYTQNTTSAYLAMQISFVVTTVTGIGLLIVGVGGIGKICATMSAVAVAVFIARYYYRVRVLAYSV